jgi:Tfp pilus assembly protein PilF
MPWMRGHTTEAIVIALVVVGFVLYAPNLNNPLFWDDADWITDNPCATEPMSHLSCLLTRDVLAGIGQSSNYYRPFLMLTFAANYAVGGIVPWGYHLVSNGLHIASASLIFFLVMKVLGNREQGVGRRNRAMAATIPKPSTPTPIPLIAGFAALLWLVHPLQTEAVTYISGRGDPLSVFLMLSSILLWLKSSDSIVKATSYQLKAISLLCSVLAILSRETAVLLPAYLMVTLMVVRYAKERFVSSALKSLRDAWPFIAVSGVYALLRLTVLNFSNTLNWYKAANVYTENVEVRIWTFLQVLWEYAGLIVVPIGLHMERNVPVLTAPWQFPAFLGLAIVAVAIWAVVYHWKRGNRLWFWAAMMFIIPLGPSSGIVAPINALIYEHWLYLSLVGPAVLAAFYGVKLFIWLAASKKAEVRIAKWLILILLTSYLIVVSYQTVQRNIIWGNTEAFYLQILSYEPQNVRVLNNLANIYADRGDLDRTEEFLVRAIEASPDQPAPYHNLGNLYRDKGDTARALELYARAVEADPQFHYAYRNAAAMLLDAQDAAGAYGVIKSWQEAIPSEPATYLLVAQLVGEQYPDIARQQLYLGIGYARGTPLEAQYQQMLNLLK